LAIEFELQELSFAREMEISYKNINIGTRRVDFFLENLVMVEIKAVVELLGVHKAQAINYCEAYKIADGLLLNIGTERLQYHRVFNKKLNQ